MSRAARGLTWRFVRVWRRDWLVNRQSWHVGFIVPLLEPVFYVAAFGVGFRMLIPAVQYQGQTVSYVMFMAPALIATSIMYNAFFENTYASFVRMYYQKTYDAIMATPLSLDEVITGEIVWGATRSVMAAVIVTAVLSVFGLVHYPTALGIVPLALLGGLGFGAFGMLFTGIVKNIDMFNLPIFLCVTPMFLFSGTFFPLDALPHWAQPLAFALPLTHLVNLTRAMCFGSLSGHDVAVSGSYLAVFAVLCFVPALHAMRRRLIR
jgi:lipooligosaccharide transport system permease protein